MRELMKDVECQPRETAEALRPRAPADRFGVTRSLSARPTPPLDVRTPTERPAARRAAQRPHRVTAGGPDVGRAGDVGGVCR